MNNKEVIEKLKAYYLTQDHETVCHALASLVVDVHRVVNCEKLPEKEFRCLEWRLNKMSEELEKFVKDGPKGELVITKMDEAPE